MKSPTNLYFTADKFLVDRANEAVKAWNWTTGRTRAELADVFNVAGGVMASYISPLLSPLWAHNIFRFHNFNQRQDILEESGDNTLSIFVELNRRSNEKISRIYLPLGIAVMNIADYLEILGAGTISIGVGSYIMRAGYQAPRKDCVQRGIEKLSEIVRQQNPIHGVAK